MSGGAPIEIEGVSHWYGEGSLRRQILHDVSATIRSGEIVILAGPSGSGKTTLLTLIGALRATQQGSLRVLGRELRGADERALTRVRRQIGYVFQAHNLIDALTVEQNVQLGLQLDERGTAPTRAQRIAELLESVGLADYARRHPAEISGGQRQRVAIARALAVGPRLILADEPTASLDRDTGRQIVRLLERLARQQGVTVLLVTHDTRILDVADRILALEDGRLSSFLSAVTEETRHLWGFLARDVRHSELVQGMREVEPAGFARLLEQVTRETREFLAMVEVAERETFDSILAQVLEAFARKAGEVVAADEARIYHVDPEHAELIGSAGPGAGAPAQRRVPIARGLAGHAAGSGKRLRAAPAEADPRFAAEVDLGAAQGVHHVLVLPLLDSLGRPFAVIELGRSAERDAFEAPDEQRLAELARGVSDVLEAWVRMSWTCRSEPGAAPPGVERERTPR